MRQLLSGDDAVDLVSERRLTQHPRHVAVASQVPTIRRVMVRAGAPVNRISASIPRVDRIWVDLRVEDRRAEALERFADLHGFKHLMAAFPTVRCYRGAVRHGRDDAPCGIFRAANAASTPALRPDEAIANAEWI